MRHSTRNLQHTVLEGKHKRPSRKRRPAVEGLEERALLSAAHFLAVHNHLAVPVPVHKHHTVPPVPVHKPANNYETIPLVSNAYINERIHDPSLVDPWDINFPQLPGQDPPIWVADQGTGVVTMYQISNERQHGHEVPLDGDDPHGPPRHKHTNRPNRRGLRSAQQVLDARARWQRSRHLHL